MLGLAFGLGLAMMGVGSPNVAVAQSSCGPCASKATLQQCSICSEKAAPGRWPKEGRERWCRQNMPACRKVSNER
jgi:hypothetical protein